MENISGSIVKITEQDEISKIINAIKGNTKNTERESVSDQPVNAPPPKSPTFWGYLKLVESI